MSLNIPIGAGFSISGNTTTYSGTWYDEWWVAHYYENFEATGIALVVEDQNDSETFRFDNEDHTLHTHVDLD